MLVHEELAATVLFRVQRVRHDHPHEGLPKADEYSRAYSLNFVQAGHFAIRSADGLARFTPGAVFVTRPGLEYTATHDDGYLNDVCTSVIVRRATWGREEPPTAFQQMSVPAGYRVFYAADELRKRAEAGDGLTLDDCVCRMLAWLSTSVEPRRFELRTAQRYLEQVDAVRGSIINHPALHHSLAKLAAAVDLSPFHLSRVFRLMTGDTVHRTVVRARLHWAARMIVAGSSVTDACYDSGFENLSHFIRSFQREFSVPPSQYRKNPRKSSRAR